MHAFTRARIALGRAGSSLPTQEILNFGVAHAQARDAVHRHLSTQKLETSLNAQGMNCIQVHSDAPDRTSFLLRPDWGRRLNSLSREKLACVTTVPIDFLIVIGDGLSATAIENNIDPLMTEIMLQLPKQWKLGPVIIATQSRVALADDIAECLGAKMVAILIGERPGLSSPDSLGIYFTYNPNRNCSDADRNCISNIRQEGLDYVTAAKKLVWLAQQADSIKKSGIALKDESDLRDISVLIK